MTDRTFLIGVMTGAVIGWAVYSAMIIGLALTIR